MIRKMSLVIVALAALVVCATAAAATPTFRNGDLTATQLERHLNGKGYKTRLKQAGVTLKGPVLCAYDGYIQVECTGSMRWKGKAVKASWSLQKRTAARAALSWTFEGAGLFEYDSAIVRPKDIGAKSF